MSGSNGATAWDIPGQFVAELFGDVLSAEERVVLWCRDSHGGSVSVWCSDLSQVDETARKMDGYSDIYFGLCTQPGKNAHSSKRGEAETAQHGFAVWVDIDVLGDTKKAGKKYAPDIPTARALLARFPMEPTMLVESGSGLHAYWTLREPCDLQTHVDRKRFASAVYGVQRVLAEMMECDVDSTHSLAHVLRIPGVISMKHGKRVTWVTRDGPRYNLGEFDEYAKTPNVAAQSLEARLRGVETSLVLDEHATVPPDKLAILMDIPNFRQAWIGRRLPNPSERDMSLASYAVEMGFSDQEVCNLLIRVRRDNGNDFKFRTGKHGDSYYRTTIDTARGGRDRAEAMEVLGENLANIQNGKESVVDSSPKIVDAVNTLLPTLRFKELQKFMDNGEARYLLKLEDGEYPIGHIDVLRSYHHFSGAVASATNRVLPMMKKGEWHKVFEALMTCCRTVDLGTGNSVTNKIKLQLSEYFSRRPVVSFESRVEALESGGSYYAQKDEKDGVVFFTRSFLAYLKGRGERMTEFEACKSLRICGASEWKQRVEKRLYTPWWIASEELEIE